MFSVTTPFGEQKYIKISRFKALDGWDIQNSFVEFAATTNKDIRRAFTLEVLSYANVVSGDQELPLSTDALIDNHLHIWENVQAVFEEVLIRNGIDPKTHAEKPHYWADAGAQMATSFMAEVAALVGPAMKLAEANNLEKSNG